MSVITEALRRHARTRPEAPALRAGAGTVGYAELDRRVERLARALAARGAAAEAVCVVALEPGPDAVVAMAAVLRAGAALLTVDVDLPAARLARMVASGGGRFLVTRSALADRVAVPGPTVLVDRLPEPSAPGPPPLPGPDPARLAYVSHTSGSTGEPNAVLLEHRGLDSYLRCAVEEFGLGPGTTALQLAPMGYDASLRDTFAPLVAGGGLVLAPRAELLDAAGFAETVAAHGVDTVLSATPSFLAFLAAQEPGCLRGLRLTACSGESLRPFLLSGGRALLGGALVNQYGPTEATLTSTRFAVPAVPETGADLVGTPHDGVAVRLLDGDLRPVPEGGVGEVFVGGVGVARGYGGAPALTADRFPPDPHGPPGSRLYRTGDLARLRPDGVLEYLGRGDRQVKVRGHRVEPGEVEGALLAHPGVAAAAVTPAVDGRGRVHLLAHVVGVPPETTDRALRAHLAATLPPHMLPRRFVRVGALPTTRSGKVDRAALAGRTP